MLPPNPRAGRSVSVPRRPADSDARPRSVSRPRTEYSAKDDGGTRGRTQQPASVRQVRPQRSTGGLSSARKNENFGVPPPLPRSATSSMPSKYSPSAYPRAPPSRASDSSSSSSSLSSSRSSFLDRMRQRQLGSSSSQSSLEIEQEDFKEESGKNRWGASEVREQKRLQDGMISSFLFYTNPTV